MESKILTGEKTKCYHCGDTCVSGSLEFQYKMFCCHGCKSVFELLQSCDLEGYYERDEAHGIKTLNAPEVSAFAYLDDEVVQEKLLSFRSEELAKVRLKLPAIHCPYCIGLIENFYKLVPGVIASHVNFVRRAFENGKAITKLGICNQDGQLIEQVKMRITGPL